MTYREARMQAAKQLAAAGVENEAAESWFLMEAVCGISRSFYLLHEQEAMDTGTGAGLFCIDQTALRTYAVAVSDR